MAEHDPRAFEDLFASEPAAPSGADMAAWIGPYERLVALLERHLEETRSFASSMPSPSVGTCIARTRASSPRSWSGSANASRTGAASARPPGSSRS